MVENHCTDDPSKSLHLGFTLTVRALVDPLPVITWLWRQGVGLSSIPFSLSWTLHEVYSLSIWHFPRTGLTSPAQPCRSSFCWGWSCKWILSWSPSWEVWTRLTLRWLLRGPSGSLKDGCLGLYCSCCHVASLHKCWEAGFLAMAPTTPCPTISWAI